MRVGSSLKDHWVRSCYVCVMRA